MFGYVKLLFYFWLVLQAMPEPPANMVYCLNKECTIRSGCLRAKPKGVALFKHWVDYYRRNENGDCAKFLDKDKFKFVKR